MISNGNELPKVIGKDRYQQLLQQFSYELYRKIIDRLTKIAIMGELQLTEALYLNNKCHYLQLAIDNFEEQQFADIVGDSLNYAIAELSMHLPPNINLSLIKTSKNIINVLNSDLNIEGRSFNDITDRYEPVEITEINFINNEVTEIKDRFSRLFAQIKDI